MPQPTKFVNMLQGRRGSSVLQWYICQYGGVSVCSSFISRQFSFDISLVVNLQMRLQAIFMQLQCSVSVPIGRMW
jgi:hypothetical protein